MSDPAGQNLLVQRLTEQELLLQPYTLNPKPFIVLRLIEQELLLPLAKLCPRDVEVASHLSLHSSGRIFDFRRLCRQALQRLLCSHVGCRADIDGAREEHAGTDTRKVHTNAGGQHCFCSRTCCRSSDMRERRGRAKRFSLQV